METMSSNKPSSYINVAADINFLQKITCCNHNIANGPADTPTSAKKVFDFVEDTTVVKDAELPVEIDLTKNPTHVSIHKNE